MTRTTFEIDVTNPGAGVTDTWWIVADCDVPTMPARFHVHDDVDGLTLIRSVAYGFNDRMELVAHVLLAPIVIDGDPEDHRDANTVMDGAGWSQSILTAIRRADARSRERARG